MDFVVGENVFCCVYNCAHEGEFVYFVALWIGENGCLRNDTLRSTHVDLFSKTLPHFLVQSVVKAFLQH